MSEINHRENLLKGINQILAERNLKPISKLGDLNNPGETEITEIVEVFDHSQRFFTDIKFAVTFPNGATGQFTVRFNARGIISDGDVLSVLINGRFAIVKQWRVPLGKWTYEIPRGFGEELGEAYQRGTLGLLKVGQLPLGILSRELRDVLANGEITSVTHLGCIDENTGTSNVSPNHWLIQIQVNEQQLESHIEHKGASAEGLKVYLWDAETLKKEIGCKIRDNHSITAVALALNHIESLARALS
jgi:hypothetical protein